MSVTVIAEPGSTHEGSIERMYELIDAAASAGVDAYKSQWVSSASALVQRRNAPDYLASYKLIQYPVDWHRSLRQHAESKGLRYGCSVYLPQDVEAVAPYVDFLKVSSFEATDEPLIDAALSAGLKLVISTGMMNMVEFDALAMKVSGRASLLHCTSAYPCSLFDLNLRVVSIGADGLSDHSHDTRVGAWAVMAGAKIIETHFRLDSTPTTNRDYDVSFTPSELAIYVRAVRDAALAYGTGLKLVQASEDRMRQFRVVSQ